MQPDAWIQILLRALPAIIFLVLGFVAATDKKSREQWNSFLYQIGSIRPDQRENQNIGRGVKWPFFVFALAFCLWPIQYFRLATRKFEVKSDIYTTERKATTIYDRENSNAATPDGSTPGATNGATNAASGPPVHEDSPTANGKPGAATPNAPAGNSTGANGKNIYGQPR